MSRFSLIFSLFLLFLIPNLTSCTTIRNYYAKKEMEYQILENRQELYQESYGEIDDPEREIE